MDQVRMILGEITTWAGVNKCIMHSQHRNLTERIMRGCSWPPHVCLAVLTICAFLFVNSAPFLRSTVPGLYQGQVWAVQGIFGILPVIVGSFYVTFILHGSAPVAC